MIATMSTVWDRTAEFLSDNLAALTPLVLLGIFVPLTLLGSLMPLMGAGGQTGDITLGLIVLALSLVTSWASLAITALAFDPAAGRAPAVQTANRRLLPVLGLGLVTLLVVLMLMAPIPIALAMSGVDLASLAAGNKPAAGDSVNGALAFCALYALSLGVVLFWGYARFLVLVTPIMIMERRGLGVYARSFVLTRRIAWKVMGVLILYIGVLWVASAAARLVFGTVFSLLIGGEGPLTLATVLTQIAVAGVLTIFSVLAVVFIAKLYLAVRDAREAIVEAS